MLTWRNPKCEACNIGELHRPCRPGVVWGSYMQNPHIMETGWIHRVREEGKFDIFTTDGEKHTLVLCRKPQEPSQGAAATLFTKSEIESWRGRTFGRASILEALEKAEGINFRLDEQTHWFDQSKTQVVLRPSRKIEVVDTEGKRYAVVRPGRMEKHKLDAFKQWKIYLRHVSRRLMGEDVTKRFPVLANPLWSNYDSEQMPQPVGSDTPLDEFDWAYDADESQDLEDHVARIKQIMQ